MRLHIVADFCRKIILQPKNCASLIAKPDIDGFLLGGASISKQGKDYITIAGAIQSHTEFVLRKSAL